jgi:hypothetical protein
MPACFGSKGTLKNESRATAAHFIRPVGKGGSAPTPRSKDAGAARPAFMASKKKTGGR